MSSASILASLGLTSGENPGCYDGRSWLGGGEALTTLVPSTGAPLAVARGATPAEYEQCLAATVAARRAWAETPAPARGEIVRKIGDALRAQREALGALISLEMGKVLSEGVGEVQEFIDICDFAVGLSRQLNGSVIPSERPGHALFEVWNPLGTVAIVTAFNFPCAVLGWNLALSLVCGNTNVWKGASSTSMVTLATARIIAGVLEGAGAPPGVFTVVSGSGRSVGDRLISDPRCALVSFTGSTSVGVRVSTEVHKRFGRTILELGGNNATIVCADADIGLALRASVFGAVGTAGQRCTSLRRLIIHESVYDDVVAKVLAAYASIAAGDPLAPGTLLGPVHTPAAVREYEEGIADIKRQGGRVLCGGRTLTGSAELPEALRGGFYVAPTVVEIDHCAPIVQTELFVPIMYVFKFATFEEAVALNNGVPQGLSSSVFTRDMRQVFKWMGPSGSDCGIVNVNAGTSGAEIGGAFGGGACTGSHPRRETLAPDPPPPSPSHTPSHASHHACDAPQKKKLVVAGRAEATRGSSTCVAARVLSTTATSCRWRRACALNCRPFARGVEVETGKRGGKVVFKPFPKKRRF
jgi:aldehyde dehydrogenase family 7 protein A1